MGICIFMFAVFCRGMLCQQVTVWPFFKRQNSTFISVVNMFYCKRQDKKWNQSHLTFRCIMPQYVCPILMTDTFLWWDTDLQVCNLVSTSLFSLLAPAASLLLAFCLIKDQWCLSRSIMFCSKCVLFWLLLLTETLYIRRMFKEMLY